MHLFKAHDQWRNRPADERFKTLSDMHNVCAGYKNQASEAIVPDYQLRAEAIEGNIKLVGRTGVPASLTHWSMGQLSTRAGAPVSYLRTLPATLATQNLNHGLKVHSMDRDNNLMFHTNGSLVLRSINSNRYNRIWNADIIKQIMDNKDDDMVPPMCYKQGNMFGGEMEPGGLYASDHDMFVFLNNQKKVYEGSPQGIVHGQFFANSEVGAKSFYHSDFICDGSCGNLIVWNARDVKEISIRHVGNANVKSMMQIRQSFRTQVNGQLIETTISKARKYEFKGATSEERAKSIFKVVRALGDSALTEKRIKSAIALMPQREDKYGVPYTNWSLISCLTEQSQEIKYAAEKLKVDTAAGKLLRRIEF